MPVTVTLRASQSPPIGGNKGGNTGAVIMISSAKLMVTTKVVGPVKEPSFCGHTVNDDADQEVT